MPQPRKPVRCERCGGQMIGRYGDVSCLQCGFEDPPDEILGAGDRRRNGLAEPGEQRRVPRRSRGPSHGRQEL